QKLADDRAGAPVVDRARAQLQQRPVGSRGRQRAQRGGDQPALLGALGRREAARAGQQLDGDLGAVEVVYARGERARVQPAVVAADVLVEELDRDGLGPAVAVELALAGAAVAGVEEDDEVLAGDARGGVAQA